MHRCYHPEADWQQATQSIEGDEAYHALKVMRMQVGDVLELFDGKGWSALVRIVSVEGQQAMQVEIVEMIDTSAWDKLPKISLALAIPKGNNMELIIQKAVELGVSRIIPLMTERTIVRLKGKEAEVKRQKWQRVSLEACKQSGVKKVPQVEAICGLKQFLESDGLPEARLCCAIVEHARSMREAMEELRQAHCKDVVILIGPEGDFSPQEYAQSEASGFKPISLGPIILRVETAVFMAVSSARYALDRPS